jgi:DUF4097 and DUF4098 domain-containing protein YvlB
MTGPDRPRRRAVWVTVAAVTAIVVILPLVVQAWGRLMVRSRSEVAAYRHPITALEIDSAHAGVRVSPGPAGDLIKIHSRLTWVTSRPRVLLSWDRTTLRITVVCGRARLYDSLECGTDLDVQVPAEIAMRAEVASGSIDVRGINGDLRLQTTSGAIRIAAARGNVWARGTSGLINGTVLSSPRVDAKLSSGAIRLGFAGSPRRLDLAITSGDVRVGLPPGEQYQVTGSSISGATKVDPELVNGRSHRVINVTNRSGSVEVGYPPPA